VFLRRCGFPSGKKPHIPNIKQHPYNIRIDPNAQGDENARDVVPASPPTTMTDPSRYGALSTPCRVWAVAAVHGEVDRLASVRRQVIDRFEPGDKLVFTGNAMGRGPAIREALDELLLFRREALAMHGNDVGDIVMLLGAQEEMWHRLFELHFSLNPAEVLGWMLDHGIAATVEAYGGNGRDGLAAARRGPTALARWTGELREAVQAAPGHRAYMSHLSHAAYTQDGALLFVSAGIDSSRPLDAQGDALWWGGRGFSTLAEPYYGCRLVVRGYDPARGGYTIGPHTATLDAGCGFGGPLTAACVTPGDGVVAVVEG
jgi:hypothetical protein